MTDYKKLNKRMIYATWIMMALTILQFTLLIESHYQSQKNQVIMKDIIFKNNILLQANNTQYSFE